MPGSVPIRPSPLPLDSVKRAFVRGRVPPRGVAWFGVRSFWGHLRHFVAAAIATENIDSRDWMTPDDPITLVDHAARVLGGKLGKGSLVDALERDVWIDFIADTGDDVSVSKKVAELLFADYELPDPDQAGNFVLAPRGDVLFFGGDTAYPVATAEEIANRVLVPFNQVLETQPKGPPRVLIGIPGNHDWYDGLDGFGRMFRARENEKTLPAASVVGISRRMLEHQAAWAREFVRGGQIEKPKALALSGYVPIQNASYFILPVTRQLHLFAADRQLRTVDDRQRKFHRSWYNLHPRIFPWVVLPDPLFCFGGPSRTGTELVRALGLDFGARSHFLLAGDVHHYERSEHDRLLHVIAGGGGAFAHPAPIAAGRFEAARRWPSPAQSRALLRQVPWKIMRGRSGFLPHLALAALFAPAMTFGTRLYDGAGIAWSSPLAITFVIALVYALIGGVRRNPAQVPPLALLAGLFTAAIPVGVSIFLTELLARLHYHLSAWAIVVASYTAAVFAGAWVFGAYLALLTLRGFEHTQAFTALDHPGFKHFLRIRVRKDGAGLDAWCLGLLDPLATDAAPLLVDQFTWRPEK